MPNFYGSTATPFYPGAGGQKPKTMMDIWGQQQDPFSAASNNPITPPMSGQVSGALVVDPYTTGYDTFGASGVATYHPPTTIPRPANEPPSGDQYWNTPQTIYTDFNPQYTIDRIPKGALNYNDWYAKNKNNLTSPTNEQGWQLLGWSPGGEYLKYLKDLGWYKDSLPTYEDFWNQQHKALYESYKDGKFDFGVNYSPEFMKPYLDAFQSDQYQGATPEFMKVWQMQYGNKSPGLQFWEQPGYNSGGQSPAATMPQTPAPIQTNPISSPVEAQSPYFSYNQYQAPFQEWLSQMFNLSNPFMSESSGIFG